MFFRRLLDAMFGHRSPANTFAFSSEQAISGRAVDAGPGGVPPTPTELANAPSQELMDICDRYWQELGSQGEGSLEAGFSRDATRRYNDYVQAGNELGGRGPEVLDWAIARLDHVDCEAREQAAYLVGELAARHGLAERKGAVVEALSRLAVRPVQGDGKEAQANAAALMALGKIGDLGAMHALRHVLTSVDWEEDDNQWTAAEVLGQLVGEDFEYAEDPVEAARRWLNEHPDV